jgi:hypothetical protein
MGPGIRVETGKSADRELVGAGVSDAVEEPAAA